MTDDRALDLADVDDDPTVQFQRWFDEAVAAGVPEPEAMCVASVGSDGMPSARMVLVKQVDRRGFVFYTNYRSHKGEELAAHPGAALVWRWFPLERQVRVGGVAERVSAAESDEYFATRPRGAQIGAWASPQSQVLPGRAALEALVEEVTGRFEGQPIPRPPWWGGIRIVPKSVEFWQGRPSRLHDRLRYRRADHGRSGWTVERLAP
ncbi:MAG: pyridoxamine 5'-phosphate oxidase [Actinomycetota bacterium]|nr:pyridoxamine 5'-phosphate oxidase [Actinomycetota bacterium]